MTPIGLLQVAGLGGLFGGLGGLFGYAYIRYRQLSRKVVWEPSATYRDKAHVYCGLAADRYDLRGDIWYAVQRGFLFGAVAVVLVAIFVVGLLGVVR